jgi:alkanesulfonate monooxygenase SsuD/methylene tetrahydromethanopterin reductase-like flavin-dependent oxidoreductase (luciferase family)
MREPTSSCIGKPCSWWRRLRILGFDSAWVSEHNFWDDGYMPSVLAFCAAAGARTRRIAIGTAVLLALRHSSLQ